MNAPPLLRPTRRHRRRLVAIALVALVATSCQLASDDFTAPVLGDRWAVVDPKGDGQVSLGTAPDGSGTLDLTVPPGDEHDPWLPNEALRVVQSVKDEDTSIETKFLSVPTAAYQIQGLMFLEDADTFLRFEYHSNSSGLRAYAAFVDDGSATTLLNKAVPSAGELHLRVARAGDSWTMSTSVDGDQWTERLSTSRALTLANAGVFAGNASLAGQAAPGFTARVDHVVNGGSPLADQDGDDDPPDDETPPTISNVTVEPGATSARVEWQTDEVTTGSVDHGHTPALELPAVASPSTGLVHAVVLGGLDPDSDYHLQVTATDAADNSTQSTVIAFSTTTVTAPTIDVWYGDSQVSGTPGHPQRWVNVLGNLSSTNGVASFTYRLNGGAPQPLSIGPDTRRLLDPGDFNVEIDRAHLGPGANTVELTAVDGGGGELVRAVVVLHSAGQTWPLPYTTSWGAASSLTEQARVVDGRWSVSDGTISPDRVGYDRLVAIGDRTWSNYEVTVPITLTALEPLNQFPSNGAALGLLVNWQGHVAVGSSQPRWGYEPLGAYASYRWLSNGHERWQLVGSYNQPQAGQPTPAWEVGETYVVKVRSELVGGVPRFSMKFWEQGTPEPATFTLEITDTDTTTSGSVVLLAHHVDARFGNVTVTPLSGGPGG